jgi:hypothetical protein
LFCFTQLAEVLLLKSSVDIGNVVASAHLGIDSTAVFTICAREFLAGCENGLLARQPNRLRARIGLVARLLKKLPWRNPVEDILF